MLSIARGDISAGYSSLPNRSWTYFRRNERVKYPDDLCGGFAFNATRSPILQSFEVRCSLLALVTLSLPLAVGGFTGFRFSLWHYLVFTLLIAIQLAVHSQEGEFPIDFNELGAILAFLSALAIALAWFGRRYGRRSAPK